MNDIKQLLTNNQNWADDQQATDPECFSRLANGQQPQYLWIGCADSRVPATQVLGLKPGDLFVHRNVANLVLEDDISAQAVIEYAVEVLKVKHIIICGHYGCGGVQAAMQPPQLATVEAWINPIRQIFQAHQEQLGKLATDEKRWHQLVELNVATQVENLSNTQVIQSAWEREQPLQLHGWVYELQTGKLKDLNCSLGST